MKQRTVPTIGILIDWLENEYQTGVISGIIDRAREKNVNLYTFVGGSINSGRKHEILRNTVYDLATSDNIDGLIILAGSIGIFSTRTQIQNFIDFYSHMPVVCVSQQYNHTCSVLIDNLHGLHDLMVHMVLEHGYRNIAFICGPPSNEEAAARLDVYRQTLIEYGIPVREELILPGYFISQSGTEAMRILLDERGIRPDAIVASNDDMAWGAIEELNNRNIRVPQDIAVTGFDNQRLSASINPPLTTVTQPLHEQGCRSLDLIIDMLAGKKPDQTLILPTELIVRESCGCTQESITVKLSRQLSSNKDLLECAPDELVNCILKIINSPVFNVTIKLEKSEIEKILSSHKAAVEKKNDDDFIATINELVMIKKNMTTDMNAWSPFIILFRFLTSSRMLDKVDLIYSESIWNKLELLIQKYLQREIAFKKEKVDRQLQMFRDVSEEFVAQTDIDTILKLLSTQLSGLGINECYIALYEGYMRERSRPAISRLIFAQNESSLIDMKHEPIFFQTKTLLPEGIVPESHRFCLIVEPIFFGDSNLGIALLQMDINKGFSFSIMRRMFINDIIKATVFIQQIKGQAVNLELTNTELKETLRTLKTTQVNLIQSEKMAALGNLVVGVSHEINTPLGVAVTATSHLQKLRDDVFALFQDNKLKKSELEKYLESSSESVRMILFNLNRAHDLIKSFKMIAVDRTSEERRSFRIREYIEELLLSLSPAFKHSKHRVEIQCVEDIEISSYPGAFSQILTNMVMNSLIHGFDGMEEGKIVIEIHKNEKALQLIYSDNGKGVEDKNVNKLFTPFFTTKRGHGSTGLGLYIIYNTVTQKLGGSIDYSTDNGKGLSFVINLPLSALLPEGGKK